MNRLLELIQDNSGGLSAIRFCMLIWLLGLFAIWGFISYQKTELQPIPDTVTTIVGIVVSGKVVQRFGEKAEPETTNGEKPPTS